MTQDIKADINQTAAEPPPVKIPAKRKYKPTGLIWFDDAHTTVKGETALWIAVITQAMMDALSHSRDAEMRYYKDEAIRWLTGNSKDFIHVCLFAGMDPDYVRRKAKKSLLHPIAWRAAPGKGKRYLERRKKREIQSSSYTVKADTKEPGPQETTCMIISGPWQIQHS